jgi:hypothetical protein
MSGSPPSRAIPRVAAACIAQGPRLLLLRRPTSIQDARPGATDGPPRHGSGLPGVSSTPVPSGRHPAEILPRPPFAKGGWGELAERWCAACAFM